MATLVAPVEETTEDGAYLLTAEESDGETAEVVLVRSNGDVSAWRNFCRHEPDQRLDPGEGAVLRDDGIACPKHGSTFDVEFGYCDHGPADGTSLLEVDVAVRRGRVYLTDVDLELRHEGGEDDGDSGSTSHLRFRGPALSRRIDAECRGPIAVEPRGPSATFHRHPMALFFERMTIEHGRRNP